MKFTWEEYGITITVNEENEVTFEHDEITRWEEQCDKYDEEQLDKHY